MQLQVGVLVVFFLLLQNNFAHGFTYRPEPDERLPGQHRGGVDVRAVKQPPHSWSPNRHSHAHQPQWTTDRLEERQNFMNSRHRVPQGHSSHHVHLKEVMVPRRIHDTESHHRTHIPISVARNVFAGGEQLHEQHDSQDKQSSSDNGEQVPNETSNNLLEPHKPEIINTGEPISAAIQSPLETLLGHEIYGDEEFRARSNADIRQTGGRRAQQRPTESDQQLGDRPPRIHHHMIEDLHRNTGNPRVHIEQQGKPFQLKHGTLLDEQPFDQLRIYLEHMSRVGNGRPTPRHPTHHQQHGKAHGRLPPSSLPSSLFKEDHFSAHQQQPTVRFASGYIHHEPLQQEAETTQKGETQQNVETDDKHSELLKKPTVDSGHSHSHVNITLSVQQDGKLRIEFDQPSEKVITPSSSTITEPKNIFPLKKVPYSWPLHNMLHMRRNLHHHPFHGRQDFRQPFHQFPGPREPHHNKRPQQFVHQPHFQLLRETNVARGFDRANRKVGMVPLGSTKKPTFEGGDTDKVAALQPDDDDAENGILQLPPISLDINVDDPVTSGCPTQDCSSKCPGELYKLTADTGCPSCECCQSLECHEHCPSGYEADDHGCPLCKCISSSTDS